jgi:hypothetical protein
LNYPSDNAPQDQTRVYEVPFNTASVMALQSVSSAKNLTIQQSLYWSLEIANYLLQFQQRGGQILLQGDDGETTAIEV